MGSDGRPTVSEVFKIETISFAVPSKVQGGAPGINLSTFFLVANKINVFDKGRVSGESAQAELHYISSESCKVLGTVRYTVETADGAEFMPR